MRQPGIVRWVREAARDYGWRDLAWGLAIGAFPLFFGPHGGGLLVVFSDPQQVNPLWDPNKRQFRSLLLDIVTIGLPLEFAVKVANRAIADAAPRWIAFPSALLVPGAIRHLALLTPLGRIDSHPLFPAEIAWYYMAIFLQGGIGLVIYARWQTAQQSMRLVQASETERARTAQQLQSARLLALQARVDPQLLFDSLGRVGSLQRSDPLAAETLLGDLIALLRAMLPGETSLTSTVEREFEVVDAWLRVTRALSNARAGVAVHAGPEVAQGRLAPLLVMPLLRAVLDVPGACAVSWRLYAFGAPARLLIAIGADEDAEVRAVEVLARAELEPLRERLRSLYGDGAQLWRSQPTMLTLDLPFSIDEGGDGPSAAVNDAAALALPRTIVRGAA